MTAVLEATEATAADEILTRIEDGVGVITINRPERLNAMSNTSGDLFEAKLAAFGLDPGVRVIVVTGAGDRGFCAGADMERLQGLVDEGDTEGRIRPPGSPGPFDAIADTPPAARTRYSSPMITPKPVIAAINGACAGIGLSLACYCDIRFASRTAVFAAGFPRRGLTAEVAIAWMLPRLVGRGAASDLLLSGRKITAAEALAMGLINAVLEPGELMDHTMAYARDIAVNVSPRSTKVVKRQLRLAMDQDFEPAMMLSYEEVVASLQGEDFKEGVASFRERRPPRFTGR